METGASPEEDSIVLLYIKDLIWNSNSDGISVDELRLCVKHHNELQFTSQIKAVIKYSWQHKCYMIDGRFYNSNDAARRLQNKCKALSHERRELEQKLLDASDRITGLRAHQIAREELVSLLSIPDTTSASSLLPKLEIVFDDIEDDIEVYEVDLI
jgi:hypothetical protein